MNFMDTPQFKKLFTIELIQAHNVPSPVPPPVSPGSLQTPSLPHWQAQNKYISYHLLQQNLKEWKCHVVIHYEKSSI